MLVKLIVLLFLSNLNSTTMTDVTPAPLPDVPMTEEAPSVSEAAPKPADEPVSETLYIQNLNEKIRVDGMFLLIMWRYWLLTQTAFIQL